MSSCPPEAVATRENLRSGESGRLDLTTICTAATEHQGQHAFNLQNSPNNHLLALFTEDGVELDDTRSAADAGVKPGMLLVLRQSTVKGGA
jgi:hypothetical protein